MKWLKAYLLTALFIGSRLAYAHPGHTESLGLMSGLTHPFSGIDHFLVILLVGFWSAYALKKIYLGPISFMLGMSLGMAMGMTLALMGVHFAWLEFGVTASVIGIGALMLVRQDFHSKMVLGLLGFFGIFHGLAHIEYFDSSQLVDIHLSLADLLGLFLATGFLHAIGVGLAKISKDSTVLLRLVRQGVGISTLLYGFLLFTQLLN